LKADSPQPPNVSVLTDAVRGFDRASLAAGVGALELLPDNAHQLLRTTSFGRAVLGLAKSNGREMSAGRWRRLLNGPPVATAYIRQLEDPLDDLVVEEAVFPAGAFRLSSGTTPEGIWVLQQLLAAFNLSDPPIDKVTVTRARDLCISAVVVAEDIYRKAEILRGTRPGGTHRGPVTVPGARSFQQLRQAVTFSETEVADLLRPHHLTPDALGAITVDGDGTVFQEPQPGSIPKPFLRDGDRYILVSPANLVGAVCHSMIAGAVGSGQSANLAAGLARSGQRSSLWSMRFLGFGQPIAPSSTSPPHNVLQALLQFDSDKVAHLMVVADDLSDFSDSNMDADWHPLHLAETLGDLIQATESEVFGSSETCNAMMHIVALQQSGRPASAGLANDASPTGSPVLAVSTCSLRAISMLESRDPLALWHWAMQRDRLHDRGARVLAWNVLDEFWAYREHWHSYYFSDQGRPTFITFDLDGVAAAKGAIQRDLDPRGAQRPDGAWIEVAKMNKEPETRAYVPLAFSAIPPVLISGDRLSLWLIPGVSREIRNGLEIAPEMIRMLSYWLGRIWAGLEQQVSVRFAKPLVLEVIFEDSSDWSLQPEPASIEADPTLLTEEAGRGQLVVSPAVLGLFARADNSGERLLVRKAVTSTFTLANVEGPHDRAARTVDDQIPLGSNRAMITVSTARHPELDISGLPAYRPVQDAARAIVLDELGDEMVAAGIPYGLVSPEDRVKVLNGAVEILFRKLEGLIRTVRPSELLPTLVAQHQRTIAERSRSQVGAESRLRDEKSTAAAAEGLHNKLPELSTISLALRFLIEYVVARPPTGLRPVSVAIVDELVALSAEIAHWGMDSDVIFYELANSKVTMLPSGRLELSSDLWAEATRSYLGLSVEAQLARTPTDPARVDEAGEPIAFFDEAAVAEFGISFTRLAEAFTEIMALEESISETPNIMLRGDFEDRLKSAGLSEAELQALLSNFALYGRAEFLKPPAPAVHTDVFPWRFNRSLSYIRRPLLIWTRSEGEYVVWANGHLIDVFENLAGLCRNGRLKAASRKMVEAMGVQTNLAGRRFSDAVGNSIEGHPDFVVRRHVKKIGGHHLSRGSGESLGDIDVLALDIRRRRVWTIEAKNLAVARSPHELRNEIAELLGTATGKSAAADRHRERTQWLRDRLPDLLASLDIRDGEPRRWKVAPLIVTESDLFSARVAKAAIPVISLRQLTEIIWKDPGLLAQLPR